MASLQNTLASIFGPFSKTCAESIEVLNKFLDSFQAATDDYSDWIAARRSNVTAPTLIYYGGLTTTQGIKEHIVQDGVFFKVSKTAYLAIKSFLSHHNSFTYRGAPIQFRITSSTLRDDIVADAEYNIAHDIASQIVNRFFMVSFDYNGEHVYYINNFIPARASISLHGYSVLMGYDPYDFNSLVEFAGLGLGALESGVNVENAGKQRINDDFGLGYDDVSQVSTSEMFSFLQDQGYFTQASDYTEYRMRLLREEDFISLVTFDEFYDEMADTNALNQINEYVCNALATAEGAINNIQSFLSGLDLSSGSLISYARQLSSSCFGSVTDFAARFANLWQRAEVQDSDGTVVFVTADQAAPKLFLSGILAPILSGVAQIAGLVVSYVFGGIGILIGGALMLVTSLVDGLRNAVSPLVYGTVSSSMAVNLGSFGYAWHQHDLSYSDVPSGFDGPGIHATSTAFCQLCSYNIDEGCSSFKMVVLPRPVSTLYMANLISWIRANNIITTSGSHLYIGHANMIKLREHLIEADDPFTITPQAGDTDGIDITDAASLDHWLRIGLSYSLTLCKLFMLTFQGAQGSITPYIGSTAQYGASSAAIESCMRCLIGTTDNPTIYLSTIINSTMSWRQIMGVDDTSGYSALPDIFDAINWSSVAFYSDTSRSGSFYDNFDYVYSNMSYAFPDENLYLLLSDPKFLYSIPYVSIGSLILTGLVTAVVAAIVITGVAFASVKIRRARARSSAKHAAKAEAAWNNYVANPTDDNYRAYSKAVFSNNVAAKFNGGGRLSKYGYWQDVGLGDDAPSNDASFEELEKLTRRVGKSIDNSF